MATQQAVDRSGWGAGPWDGEPDRVEFKAHGLPCLMRRTERGNWCGYVAVPPGHPLHGKGYDEEEVAVSAHGGLTFAGPCSGDICHVPASGEPDDVHWFGFDCAHYDDFVPAMVAWRGGYPALEKLTAFETYRDANYVRRECEDLAEQLKCLMP
jgi:hypothetical protein